MDAITDKDLCQSCFRQNDTLGPTLCRYCLSKHFGYSWMPYDGVFVREGAVCCGCKGMFVALFRFGDELVCGQCKDIARDIKFTLLDEEDLPF